MRTLALRRIGIAWAYAAVFAILMFVSTAFVIPLALVFVPHFRYWMYRLFLSSVECPTCGKAIALEGSWKCGCGFTQHRHAYKPCVKCKSVAAEMDCPHCEHGMFL